MDLLESYPYYILAIAGTIIIALLVDLFYYWFFFSRLAFYRHKKPVSADKPVSVVICAHNEAFNLLDFLPQILEQDYPDFEVIVVNDSSTDETKEILLEISQLYPNLKIVNVNNSVTFFRSKKFPLSVGIKSAKNEYLLLTDADCRPTSNQWLRNMQAQFDGTRQIVLGFSQYEKQRGLFNLFIRYDAFQNALQYLSYTLAGLPFMGVGRNLAYCKTLFYQQKGFISHYKISPGDDDLFINQAANKRNTVIEIQNNSQIISKPLNSFAAWVIHKRKQMVTFGHYKPKFKVLLGLQGVGAIVYYSALAVLTVLLIQSSFFIELAIIAGLHFFRLINRLIIFGYASNRLNQKKLFLSSLLLDPFFTFFNPLVAFSNSFSGKSRWK